MSASVRRALLLAVGLLLIAVVLIPARRHLARRESRRGAESTVSVASALSLAPAWLGGRAPARDSLAGHPVAVLVWSDTDPLSLDALAAAEGWHEAYARFGIRVIGVHAPDFAFAADASVPQRAAGRAAASFPIALDPTGQVRDHLGRIETLPCVIVVDARGAVVLRRAGSDAVAVAEHAIRELVMRLHPGRQFPADPGAPSATPAPGPGAHTMYLGTARVVAGPLVGVTPGGARPFTAQFRFQVEGSPYVPYPVGWWIPNADGLTADRGGAATFVAMRYDAPRVYAVMSPPSPGAVRVWLLRDDAWIKPGALGADARLDPHGGSYVDVTEPRLYDISRGVGEHVIKLSPADRGLTLHALVFTSGASQDAAR